MSILLYESSCTEASCWQIGHYTNLTEYELTDTNASSITTTILTSGSSNLTISVYLDVKKSVKDGKIVFRTPTTTESLEDYNVCHAYYRGKDIVDNTYSNWTMLRSFGKRDDLVTGPHLLHLGDALESYSAMDLKFEMDEDPVEYYYCDITSISLLASSYQSVMVEENTDFLSNIRYFFIGIVAACMVITLLLCCGGCLFRRIFKKLGINMSEAELAMNTRSSVRSDSNRRASGAGNESGSSGSEALSWETVWSEPSSESVQIDLGAIVPWKKYDVDEDIKEHYFFIRNKEIVNIPIAQQMRLLRIVLESIGLTRNDLAITGDGSLDIIRLNVLDFPSFRLRLSEPKMMPSYLSALQEAVNDPTHFAKYGSGWAVSFWLNTADKANEESAVQPIAEDSNIESQNTDPPQNAAGAIEMQQRSGVKQDEEAGTEAATQSAQNEEGGTDL